MIGPRGLVRGWVRRSRTKSPWLVHFDCGGCNGCDIEVLDTLTPRYSAERFGVVNVGDPRQADVLLVTGPASRRNGAVLRAVYEQMNEPKAVVAVGSCAAHGGVFRGAPNILGGVGEVVPVDVFVPGCPPAPWRILDGVIEALPNLASVRAPRSPSGGPGGPGMVTGLPGGRPWVDDDDAVAARPWVDDDALAARPSSEYDGAVAARPSGEYDGAVAARSSGEADEAVAARSSGEYDR